MYYKCIINVLQSCTDIKNTESENSYNNSFICIFNLFNSLNV